MMPTRNLTLEDAAERIAGLPPHRINWTELARDTRMSTDFLMRKLRPGYREHRNDGVRAARMMRSKNYASSRVIEADVAARLAEIPRDTRSPSAVLLGDPIPNDPRRSDREHRG